VATKRPTLADLAAAAGVSRATASNAFNRPERLSAALRTRLLSLADELGYAGPDPTAAGLRRGRVGAIGVIIADRLTYAFSDPAAVQMLDGVAEALSTTDIALLLLAGDGHGGGPAPARVMSAAVDGFVSYCLGRDDPVVDILRRRRLPTVFIDQPMMRGTSSVDLDEEGGSTALARHLLELGHRRFGIVTLQCAPDGGSGPITAQRRSAISYAVVRRRLDAVLRTVAASGVDPASVRLFEPAHNVPEEGERALHWMLEQTPRPTAVICQSDQLAIGALAAASARGLVVPRDISIAGFDDIDAGRATEPPLTTVHQPLRERGRLAGQLVLEAVTGARPRRVKLPSELVVRASTGKARRSGRSRDRTVADPVG
jgi:DNA-binding LacI/PurR family transcriptional regulator